MFLLRVLYLWALAASWDDERGGRGRRDEQAAAATAAAAVLLVFAVAAAVAVVAAVFIFVLSKLPSQLLRNVVLIIDVDSHVAFIESL